MNSFWACARTHFREVLRAWWALAIGAPGAIVGWATELFTDVTVGPTIWVGLVALTILVAQFQVFHHSFTERVGAATDDKGLARGVLAGVPTSSSMNADAAPAVAGASSTVTARLVVRGSMDSASDEPSASTSYIAAEVREAKGRRFRSHRRTDLVVNVAISSGPPGPVDTRSPSPGTAKAPVRGS